MVEPEVFMAIEGARVPALVRLPQRDHHVSVAQERRGVVGDLADLLELEAFLEEPH
jgi:hypothetical protein